MKIKYFFTIIITCLILTETKAVNLYTNTIPPEYDSLLNIIKLETDINYKDSLSSIIDLSGLKKIQIPGEHIFINNCNKGFYLKETKNKGTAIILNIFTGILGGHRIYLGSKPVVIIAYACTFGFFGIVTIIDLVHLIIKKDISPYENNDKIFMWTN